MRDLLIATLANLTGEDAARIARKTTEQITEDINKALEGLKWILTH